MKKCRYADKYKAIRPPKCNHGDPCDACKKKWVDRHPKMTKAHEREVLRQLMY